MEELARTHSNELREQEPGLIGIGTTPTFAIGQRALLVQTPHGNLLWDCISLLDEATIEGVRQLGGVDHIAISHPHYYASMVEWADAFGAVIHLAEADREFVMRPDPAIQFWTGSLEPLPGVRLIQTGGHFEGATVLNSNGALLSGDVIQVLPGRDPRVSFMRSYPMLLPLPEPMLDTLLSAIEPLVYDRLYGAWWDRVIPTQADEAVQRSAQLYRRWLSGEEAQPRDSPAPR